VIVAALELMLSTALLMLLVLAARAPVARLFGAGWAYALWLLPLLVPLLSPLLPAESGAAFTLILPPLHAVAAPIAPDTGGGAEGLLLALALWAGGAAMFAIWQQSTYSAFLLHLGPQGRAAVPASFGGIKVVESDAVDGPAAVGILKRRIVVPLDFGVRYSAAEQRLALEHELIHHRRFDILWNWVGLAMLTLHWFNPIAHFAYRAFRADQELACDAAVARRAPDQRHAYACALIKSASYPGLIAACPLGRAEFLKRRLQMMKQHRAGWARTLGGAASLAVLAAAGLAVGTPSFAQREAGERSLVAANNHRDPIISKADIERLRAKCGGDESGTSVICSKEEARDPEVQAIMKRTNERVHAHVKEATRHIDAARISARVEQATAGIAAARAEAAAEAVAERMERFDRSEVDERIEEAMERTRERHAEYEGEHRLHVREAIEGARRQLALIDVDAIRRSALASAQAAIQVSQHALSRREQAELRREMAQMRVEISREVAAGLRDAQRELDRELRALPPRPPAPPAPPSFRAPPAPPAPPLPPAPPVR
jgi:beta-lactamase regulating signal transducer with metallopeptidase domain